MRFPAQYELRTSEFGVLAMQQDTAGELIYLPLRISRNGERPAEGNYVVTVISGAEIEEIYWSLCTDGENPCIVYDQALGRSPYAANQPIAIELDQLVSSGRYLLTISAQLRSGSFDTIEVPFQYSP